MLTQKTNNFERFWRELKRRKVVHVITVYAAVSFVILQLVDIVERPLRLPDWTTALVIVLLCIGFIISVLVSWIYDITPAGVKKTKPINSVKHTEQITHAVSSRWKIATFISGVIIISLLAFNFISRKNLNSDISKLEKSIAVLPFRNDSQDTSNIYFINGLMEEVLNNLQKIGAFSRVLSRNSVEQFRNNTTKTTPEIAKELGVNYIIEGSGQKYGNIFRLTVQLIKAKGKENHLWANSYEQEINSTEDIFKIMSQIAQSIATELKAAITPEEKLLIEKKPTENLDAYNFYQLGIYYINQNFEESLREGVKCFEQAIKLDPRYAMAYVGLAQCYQFLVRYVGMSQEEGYPKAKESILKAIELDGSLGEAYATLGLIKIVFDRDIYGPEQEFQKAIKLSPNSAEVYSSYAQYLRWLGRYDEGIIIAKRAAELDPLAPISNFWLGAIYFYAGRYDESIDYFKKMLQMDSNYVHCYTYLACNYIFKESYSNAISYADKALSFEEARKSPIVLGPLGWVYGKAGEIIKAKEILSLVEELSTDMPYDPSYTAMIFLGLGEQEKVIEMLLKAYKANSANTIYYKVMGDCWYKEISSDPRYKELLKKIGFRDD